MKLDMKNIAMAWKKIFAAGVFVMLCFTFLPTARAAGAENEAVLQELKAIRNELEALRQESKSLQEEIAGLREEFKTLLALAGLGGDLGEGDWEGDPDSMEAADIIGDLHSMKVAALMFSVDSAAGDAENLEALINADGSAQEILGQYSERPERIGPEHRFLVRQVDGQEKWLVGCDLSAKPEAVRQKCQERAAASELVNEKGEPYGGEGQVYMIVR